MKRLIYIAILLVYTSCSKDSEVVRTIELGEFKKIEFNDAFEVVFHTSEDFRIVATGTERFTEGLKTSFRGDSVVIDNKVKAAWLRPESNKVRLDIYCDSLSQIKANESCRISTGDTLRSDDLILIVGSKLNIADLKVNCSVFGYYNVFPCSGVMTFSGKTDQLNIWNDALMEVEATALTTKRALVENRSGASCRVTVLDEINYSILNRGDIFLSGNPDFINMIEDSGEGELILIE
ncbi:MAG TPA: DUF2807 domain-containing protein [Cryomorphaceae bacterium]|nr:DUF2807 domain-containing protein [Cryomorphaceae bacterium]